MKNKYDGSLHDLMTRECEFSIADCSGTYYIKRLNEFGDAVLKHLNMNDEWETCAHVYVVRIGELLLKQTSAGIVFEKRIKLSKIKQHEQPTIKRK